MLVMHVNLRAVPEKGPAGIDGCIQATAGGNGHGSRCVVCIVTPGMIKGSWTGGFSALTGGMVAAHDADNQDQPPERTPLQRVCEWRGGKRAALLFNGGRDLQFLALFSAHSSTQLVPPPDLLSSSMIILEISGQTNA